MEEQENELEIVYGITSEEIYNSIISCITSYEFLDKVKEDMITIKMDYHESIEATMMRCVESICHLISEIHSNTVPQDDGDE